MPYEQLHAELAVQDMLYAYGQHVCHTMSVVVKPIFQTLVCFASILDVQIRLLWIGNIAFGYVQEVHPSYFTAGIGTVIRPLLSQQLQTHQCKYFAYNEISISKSSVGALHLDHQHMHANGKPISSTSLVLLHTTYTCAFQPGCLMSHNWLHTPDCKL